MGAKQEPLSAPINEVIGMLHEYAPARLKALVERHPDHNGILDPGVIAGTPHEDAHIALIKLDACREGLTQSLMLLDSAEETVRQLASQSRRLERAILLLGVTFNSGLLVLLSTSFALTISYAAAAGGLLASIGSIVLNEKKGVTHNLEALRLISRRKEEARRVLVEFRIITAKLEQANVPEALDFAIRQCNQLIDEIREVTTFQGLIIKALPSPSLHAGSRARLHVLLVSLFHSTDALHRWVWRRMDSSIEQEVGWNQSMDDCVADLVRVMECYGMIDHSFFDALSSTFKKRAPDVQAAYRQIISERPEERR